jgi:hypothetical protein
MSESRLRSIVLVFLLAFATRSFTFSADGPVKVWEEQVVIPTYLMGAPDPNPQFYLAAHRRGRNGASIPIRYTITLRQRKPTELTR